mmetsp:Transcript_75387/g.201461  ORF Transcript_75387/g.201461 Transcript_75387/m.201461 type:complete len:203 (+) Transcript_75387:743-1351(+)
MLQLGGDPGVQPGNCASRPREAAQGPQAALPDGLHRGTGCGVGSGAPRRGAGDFPVRWQARGVGGAERQLCTAYFRARFQGPAAPYHRIRHGRRGFSGAPADGAARARDHAAGGLVDLLPAAHLYDHLLLGDGDPRAADGQRGGRRQEAAEDGGFRLDSIAPARVVQELRPGSVQGPRLLRENDAGVDCSQAPFPGEHALRP